MTKEGKELLMIVAFGFFTILLCVGGHLITESVRCASAWKDSGIESRFEVVSGCQVKTWRGWIPEERFREVSQ